ncbi:class I SAM-dependent methyltransferase [Candidatus Laterigemmans baculatus]|uniref:class I SAM-dependent methyltransferase n=1 Tax=Candidatus Laterigemmans baculatus TaxID=2770505 RepID=UPI0013DCB4CC|nr:class I SAM-dependent methyltransferase [Candidatus Laterigemmans baculatus]
MSQIPSAPRQHRPPDWRLPPGVAPGTWDYVHAPEIANSYDEFLRDTALTALDLRLIGELLPAAPSPASLVADLGCGTGRANPLLLAAGYRVLAIDLSQAMLRRLQSKLQSERPHVEAEPNRVLPLRANLVTLGCVAEASVTHAVCLFSTLGMIRSRRNRRTALAHVHRILAPGGRFLVHAHNRTISLREPGGPTHLARSWWRSRRDADADFGDRTYAYRGLPNMFLHSFTRRELWSDLRSAGFRVARTIPVTVRGDRELPARWWFPSLRAGGFLVVAEKE